MNKKAILLLSLSIEAFKQSDFKKAGKLFSESIAADDNDNLISSLKSLTKDESFLTSQSMQDRSLPLGDKRQRFKKDLDEDYVDDVESLEDILHKDSDKAVHMTQDDYSNPSISEEDSQDEKISELKDEEDLEIDQMVWETPDSLPPSISKSMKITI